MWKTVGTACVTAVVVALSAMGVSNRSLRATAAQPRVAVVHSAVVRSLTTIGGLSPEHRTFSMTVPIALAAECKRENVRLTVFVQETESRRIVGAATTPLVSALSLNRTEPAGDAWTRTP